MKTIALPIEQLQGEGRGFLEGLGAFGPQPLQDSIPLSARPGGGRILLTAGRPTGLLREGQGGETGSKPGLLSIAELTSLHDRLRWRRVSMSGPIRLLDTPNSALSNRRPGRPVGHT